MPTFFPPCIGYAYTGRFSRYIQAQTPLPWRSGLLSIFGFAPLSRKRKKKSSHTNSCVAEDLRPHTQLSDLVEDDIVVEELVPSTPCPPCSTRPTCLYAPRRAHHMAGKTSIPTIYVAVQMPDERVHVSAFLR